MKIKPLTYKELQFFMWFFMATSILLSVILTYETGQFNVFGYTVWERDLTIEHDYQDGYRQGKMDLIMEMYTPNELHEAVENGDFDYELLPPVMKQLLDGMREKEK